MSAGHAPTVAAYPSDNIGSWTSLRARRDPDREAVVCGSSPVTASRWR